MTNNYLFFLIEPILSLKAMPILSLKAFAKTAPATLCVIGACMAPLPSHASPLVNLLSFQGSTFAENCALGGCYIPPDTNGAIGTTQFLETSNGSISVYDRTTLC